MCHLPLCYYQLTKTSYNPHNSLPKAPAYSVRKGIFSYTGRSADILQSSPFFPAILLTASLLPVLSGASGSFWHSC